MKEALEVIGAIVLSIVSLLLVIAFGMWIFSDPYNWIEDQPQPEEIVYSYQWRQCFDNDKNGVTIEYADKMANDVESRHPGGEWTMRGRQDILGCTGDLYYVYQIK